MISIIVPVYNSAAYLNDCLSSILNQTYVDWECITIDDGSTDESGQICDYYAWKDDRFIAIHQDNQGVSSARNRGLDNMVGDCVCFVDADDYLEQDYLKILYSSFGNADIVLSGQVREFNEGCVKRLLPSNSGCFNLVINNVDSIIDLEDKLILFTPHEKLYKASIIQANKLRFSEDTFYGEDLVFNYQYLDYCMSISVLQEAKYHYRITNNGLSAAFRPNQFEQDYSQWRIVRDFHKKRGLWNDDVEKYLYQRLWGIVYDGIFLYSKLVNPPRDYLSRILSIPEICDLKRYKDSFSCARWIKCFIIFRLDKAFVQYFKLKKR